MSKRNLFTGCLLAAVLLLGGGCGDSPQRKLQRAHIAIANNQLPAALKLIDQVLDAEPGNAQALVLKAQTQMALSQLDDARATIDQLLQKQSDSGEAHRAHIVWSFLSMENLLKQSAFGGSEKLQLRFKQVQQEGRNEVDWLANHEEKSGVEVDFFLARFALADVRRLAVLMAARKAALQGTLPGENVGPGDEVLNQLKQESDAKLEEAQQYLKKTLEADPRRGNAMELYAQILTTQSNWPELWRMSDLLGKQEKLPPGGVGQFILALLAMPERVHDQQAQLAVAWKLQNAVDPALKDSVTWKINSARLYLRKGDAASAQPLLEAVRSKNPGKDDDALARFLLAQVYLNQKAFSKAKETIDSLPNELQGQPDVLAIRAIILMRLGDRALALETVKQGLKINPDHILLLQTEAELAAQGNDFEVSLEAVRRLYELTPANPLAIRLYTRRLASLGQTAKVIDILERTERIDPLTVELLEVLADGYLLVPDADKALRYAQELVKQKPDFMDYGLKLAEALVAAGKETEARKVLTDLRQKYPAAPAVELRLGQLLLRRQNYDRAIPILQGVVAGEPANAEARLALAQALISLSLTNEALDQVNAVLDRSPMDARAHTLASDIYRLLGDKAKMEEHLWKIDPAQIDPVQQPTLAARLKIRQRDYEEAANICNRAVAAGSTDPWVRLLLAEVFTLKNQPRVVEDNIVAAIRLQPKNLQIYMMLARFYHDQKPQPEVTRGIQELTKLESLNPILARVAQAALLNAAKRYDEASEKLQSLVAPLIQEHNRLVLAVVETLSRNHVSQGKRDQAIADYEPLLAARFMDHDAELRQIDLVVLTKENLDGVVKRLDALVGKLTPEEERLRSEIINRMLTLARTDRALALLDQWIADSPRKPDLIRFKGNVLLAAGRAPEAIKVFSDLAAQFPDNLLVRMSLAQAHLATYDYPAAERVFLDMEKIDPGARIVALAELARMYVGLGLKHQAAAVFTDLEATGRRQDPRLIYALGQTLASLGKNAQARDRLKDVPPYAPQYTAAQILMAQLEQRDGLGDDARKRLQQLVSDPRTAGAAASELLNLNFREQNVENLLKGCDQALRMESLTDPMRLAWLDLRITLCDQNRDWEGVLMSLERYNDIRPDSVQSLAARVAVLVKLKRVDKAKQLYQDNQNKLANDPLGPLLAVVVGLDPSETVLTNKDQPYPALSTFLVRLARGEVEAAGAAVDKCPPMRTIYPSDLRKILERSDVRSRNMEGASRVLALALVCTQVHLRQLTIDYCQDVIIQIPSLPLAHALQLYAILEMGQPSELDKALGRVEKSIPTSGLALYVAAARQEKANDFTGAAETYRKLLQREPDNFYLTAALAHVLQQSGKFAEAISLLQTDYDRNTPNRVQVANDLAYLLAEHQPADLDKAQKIAQWAADQTQQLPALLDTAGWIAHLRGNNAAAMPYLGKAIVGLHDVPAVHYHLGVVYNDLKNPTWARYHLTEAADGPKETPEVGKAKALLDALTRG